MPKLKWDRKDFITKLLVGKYDISADNVMKKNFRHQLIELMTPEEIKVKIKILSNNTHGDYSLEIKELRVQLKNYVCKYLRRVSGTGESMSIKLQFSGNQLGRYLCINSM